MTRIFRIVRKSLLRRIVSPTWHMATAQRAASAHVSLFDAICCH